MTLAGPPGVGKTTLAMAVCNYVAVRRYRLRCIAVLYCSTRATVTHFKFNLSCGARYNSDGVFFVRMKGKRCARTVIQSVIDTLEKAGAPIHNPTNRTRSNSGSKEQPEQEQQQLQHLEDMLYAWLRHRRCLLVFDHVDDFIDSRSAAKSSTGDGDSHDGVTDETSLAQFIESLLGQTKGVRVLLTTQVPLDQTISFGERILPLEPLSPADCQGVQTRHRQHHEWGGQGVGMSVEHSALLALEEEASVLCPCEILYINRLTMG